MTQKKTHILPLTIIAISALLLGIAAAAYLKSETPKPPTGIRNIGGNFTLQSNKGPVSLTDLKGKVVPLYFGYTSCPDICPTSLSLLTSAIRQLSEAQQKQIQPVLISVDPDRDTPEKLAIYANTFYPGMLGLTGKKEVIDKVTWNYRALYKIVPMEDSAMGYSVDHTATIYIIGKNGVIQSMAPHDTTVPKLTEELKTALTL